MKKIIIILVCYLACINLCACSDNRSPMGYTEEITDETVINNMVIKKHIITAEYQTEEGVFSYPAHSYLNASIEFPQLSDMKTISTQEKINNQLKEVAMQSLNNRSFDETLKLFQDIANKNSGTSEFWSGENEYNILYIGDKYISLNYEGNSFFGGAYPLHFSNYVTISLDTGEIIAFTEYFSKEKILDAITSLEFEWIDGQYTGGYTGNEPEVIEEFVAAVKQLEDMDTTNNIYNSASTYNFAMDEQFAYINFPFYDSLDGYVTLRFTLNILKNPHSLNNLEEETYAVTDYPLIDIPIRYNESEVVIVIANNMMHSDEYLFSNNKKTLENMQTKFHVITFPVDRGTTPDSKVFIYEDNILIREISFLGEYSNDEKFDLDSLPKEDIEEKIGQKLPPLF